MARTQKKVPTISKSAEGFTRTPVEIGTGSKKQKTYKVLASIEVPQIVENGEGLRAAAAVYAKFYGVDDGMPYVAQGFNSFLSGAEKGRVRSVLMSEKATEEQKAAAIKSAPNVVALPPKVVPPEEKALKQGGDEIRRRLAAGEKVSEADLLAAFSGLIAK